MYVPAAPWGPKRASRRVRPDTLAAGDSPSDFPDDHYERTWTNRVRVDEFNERGRPALSLG